MSIYQALVDRLQTVDGISRIQKTNEAMIQPKANESWVRPTLLRAESTGRTKGVNGYLMQKGLLRIDLFTTKGTGEADQLSQAIRNAFPERGDGSQIAVGTNFLSVLNAWVENGREDGAQYLTPIFVRWQMPER
ncbi:phage tail terminator-like protein [Acidovorax sp. M14]|uniref:phage tail terminator-like protein n=1 Tax=Acidovorax sp. M14 TaxID=3411354 RepID=UPI003BF46563